jgi:hypothetical protein
MKQLIVLDIGSNKALPDFLKEKHQFKYLVRVDGMTAKLTRYRKDHALHRLYSNKKGPTQDMDKHGYVQHVT